MGERRERSARSGAEGSEDYIIKDCAVVITAICVSCPSRRYMRNQYNKLPTPN